MPAPSPTTNPSRCLSQGRLARCGSSFRCDSARMAANPPMPIGVMQASAPPQIITSAVAALDDLERIADRVRARRASRRGRRIRALWRRCESKHIRTRD